jgi:hypothetical protein
MLPRLDALADWVVDTVRRFGRDFTWRQLAGQETPETLEDAYLSLLTAWLLQNSKLAKERLAPCLACSRFFVAVRQNAETCSDACRKRLSRSRLVEVETPEAKDKRKREQAQYMREYRKRKARRK